ncbi:hypothetical protein PR202_gb28557 [Eleusine coracana subsp. coracana]|uniref:PHD-type domain-containing protein n=1 Tax=Eleusine coracana subsp. coracana TaxID=191504 RepID=A0AAV5FWN6_ELECO|nr:hypothetical protein PR202_gb28557 [Eleusine coracana subsp. coracana]
MEEAGGGDSFVLRSGVRSGLKREFAFAIASQAALEPLGRTRRSSRTLLLNTPKPKRPRRPITTSSSTPKSPQSPQSGGAGAGAGAGEQEEKEHEQEEQQSSGPVLALMAAAPPSPQPPPPKHHGCRCGSHTPHAHPMETMESSPRRITRSMLLKPPPPPPDNAKEPESQALRRFTRSLLPKDAKADHSNNDDDLSGTTTASNSSSSPSTTSINKSTSVLHANKIPTNLKALLATGLLEGQPVKYIMRKGKGCVLGLVSASSTSGSYQAYRYTVLLFFMQRPKSSFSTLRRGKFALLCDSCLESKGSRNSTRLVLRSLNLMLVELQDANRQKMSSRQSDDLCSICSDGGQLLLCDTCPRAFHRECVGLSAMPKGTWCCRYCENRQQRESCLAYNNNAIAAGRIEGIDPLEQIFTRSIRIATTPETGFGGCALCKLHDFSRKKFSTRTVLLCDQCGREYHVGCLKEHGLADLMALPEGAWYCSADCVKINQMLEDLLTHGAEPVSVVDMDLIKKKREERGLTEDGDLDIRWRVLKDKSSIDSKLVLSKAVAIFHESFDPIIQITTGRDLIPAMVYGNNVVSAGLFRIMGSEIAELPLVATSRDSQGLVKHFVLPAAEEAESIWTQRFGFTKISQDELREYLKGGRTTVFQGTSTLHKLVPNQEC